MTDGDSPSGTDAFALVGDETRVAILRALAAARREGGTPIGFADLRRRVGMRDSGNFNYHVDRLVGSLVEREADGYRLTYAGESLVGTLLAGTHESHRLEVDASDPCPYCGTGLSGTFEDGVLHLTCESGHYFEAYVPPGAAAERSTEALLSLAGRTLRTHVAYAFDGVCPFCYGSVSLAPEPADRDYGPGVIYRGGCERCGHEFAAPPELAAIDHPAVVAFYHERGQDVTGRAPWALDLGTVDATRSTDPTGVTLTLTYDGATLAIHLDGTGDVLRVTSAAQS
jgi:DNA-binding transcriptional ArsR family regulator